MRRPQFIARQSSCPSGWVGYLIARIMANETSPENGVAIRLLDPRPVDSVLEIGFGHGRTIAELARLCPKGSVSGIDTSATMVEMASQLNRDAVATGLVKLDHGDSASMPYPSQSFDSVLSVHTLYFWSQPGHHLAEIHRVLKPGGKLVLGYKPDSKQFRDTFPDSVYAFRSPDEVRSLLMSAGFKEVRQVAAGSASRDTAFSIAC